MQEPDKLEHIYFDCGPRAEGKKKTFYTVFIIGPGFEKSDIEELKKNAKSSNQSVCIIGDGKNAVPSYPFLKEKLKDKVSQDTVICILGHGGLAQKSDGSLNHIIKIVGEKDPTSKLLEFCAGLYPAECSARARIDLFSCYGGAAFLDYAKCETGIVPVILHSGKQYVSSMMYSWRMMFSILQEAASENPYEHLLKYLLPDFRTFLPTTHLEPL